MSNILQISKENLIKIFETLKIPFKDWNSDLLLAEKERELLDENDLKEISDKYCFIGIDGTATKLSEEEDIEVPIIVSASAIMWGIESDVTKTYPYNQRIVINSKGRIHRSTVRTTLEIRLAICVLMARKFKKIICSNCPFKDSGCQFNNDIFKPYNHFSEKLAVAILDLPIIFAFVRTLSSLDPENRNYLIDNLRTSFNLMKENELPVIFVSHKSRLRVVSQELNSELDDAIESLGKEAKTILELIIKDKKTKDIKELVSLSEKLEDEYLTDFDLLELWLSNLASPTPIFNVKPDNFNGNWNELKFHYLTWGYKEQYEGSWYYAPSTWVRIGYTPALTPLIAHKIMCLDMILGKGHSISLTMAHTQCNFYKDHYVRILIDHFNKNRSDKHKFGLKTKEINKWRMFQR